MDKDYLNNYYSNYDEDGRLDRKHSKIEFLTSIKYIEKYLKLGDRILEVGAGTGRYSLHFARQGYQINAIELVQHNIDVFKSKILSTDSINLIKGNALDLSVYDDNTFDVTMVLGPMYHVFNLEDKNKVIEKALRVTKKSGYLFIAYITHDAVIASWGLLKGNLTKNNVDKMFTDDYKCISTPKELFAMFHVKEFNDLLAAYPIEHMHTVATDGIAPWFRELFHNIDEEQYQEWLKYHFATCEREDLMGYSNHVLYVGKKK
ncbi:class I SAM-dependent methyltransferase [Mycoplasmatota bacterium WC44]